MARLSARRCSRPHAAKVYRRRSGSRRAATQARPGNGTASFASARGPREAGGGTRCRAHVFRSDPDHSCSHGLGAVAQRSEEHTSELQSLMRTSYAVFCLKTKKKTKQQSQRLKLKKHI